MKSVILFLHILFFSSVIAQKEIKVIYDLDKTTLNGNELEVEQLRYYISNVKLIKDNKIIYSEENSYHLIDHSTDSSSSFTLSVPENICYDHLEFNIGVDSTKNMKGVHGGDLDPTNGMYWTWQSGYINFKLEAKAKEDELSYHIGGFMYPNNACRRVNLQMKRGTSSSDIHINVRLNNLLDKININEINHIMSPGKTAMSIADLLPYIFIVL